MLYTLIGNGNANKKEVVSSLQSLYDAATEGGDEFWMILTEEEEPSDTLKSVYEWVDKSNIYYEAVVGENSEGAFPKADDVHKAKRPVSIALRLTPVRVQEGEGFAVLVLSDDMDSDEDVLFAISRAIDNHIPVYDLGGQMVELSLEDEEENAPVATTLETPSSEDFVIAHDPAKEDHEEMELTRDDLEGLTRDELKSLVTSRGLTPRDMRSKDAMIDVILEGNTETEPEPVQEDPEVVQDIPEVVPSDPEPVVIEEDKFELALEGKTYYLLEIDADGAAEMQPLTAKQAQILKV